MLNLSLPIRLKFDSSSYEICSVQVLFKPSNGPTAQEIAISHISMESCAHTPISELGFSQVVGIRL